MARLEPLVPAATVVTSAALPAFWASVRKLALSLQVLAGSVLCSHWQESTTRTSGIRSDSAPATSWSATLCDHDEPR